jgi:hypothetical protein
MSFDLLRRSRWFSFAALMALSGGAITGCTVASEEAGELDEEGASTDAITQVNHSKVERQSIGNCWIYATASWYEALNKMATGQEMNSSQSYITFWHWFDQVANGAAGDEISTGGSYSVSAELINRYGIMLEKDFIPEEAEAEMSNRQASALSTINASLKSGVLKDSAARRDRALVLKELFKAWNLNEAVQGYITKTFGPSVSKTLDKSYKTKKTGTLILRAKDVPAKLKDPQTGKWENLTLQDAIGTKGSWWGPRQGKYAWNEADYPYDASGRRQFQKRIQKALHDGQPVIMSWLVDFNALASNGSFTVEEIKRRGGPGRQGGHMVVAHDYEIDNVPGFGTLKAGTAETRPEALTAALDNKAVVKFIRIKNSWGTYRPDRWNEASIPGYHDLYMTYLDGPVKQCEEKDGVTDPNDCRDATPLWDSVFPPGY